MEEIRVNEYVRFNDGKIDKIIDMECWADNDIWLVGQDSYTKTTDDVIVKHSKNIIDLIEVDDYVNGKRVIATDNRINDNGEKVILTENYDEWTDNGVVTNKDIKSIVTKEMFENIEYKVGD